VHDDDDEMNDEVKQLNEDERMQSKTWMMMVVQMKDVA